MNIFITLGIQVNYLVRLFNGLYAREKIYLFEVEKFLFALKDTINSQNKFLSLKKNLIFHKLKFVNKMINKTIFFKLKS